MTTTPLELYQKSLEYDRAVVFGIVKQIEERLATCLESRSTSYSTRDLTDHVKRKLRAELETKGYCVKFSGNYLEISFDFDKEETTAETVKDTGNENINRERIYALAFVYISSMLWALFFYKLFSTIIAAWLIFIMMLICCFCGHFIAISFEKSR